LDERLKPSGDRLLRAGVWQQIGPLSLVLGATQHEARQSMEVFSTIRGDSIDTLPHQISSIRTLARRWSETEARLMWAFGRVAIDGRFGYQHVDTMTNDVWGSATATMALGSRLSLVGAYGTRPSREWLGVSKGQFASLGIRLAPAALSRPPAPAHVQPTANRF